MAEPKPAPNPTTPPSETSPPKLKAVSEKGAPATGRPARDGVSRTVFAAVVVLLVLALAGLWAQTRRASSQAEQIVALEGQVGSLESELSVANDQLATYGVQMGMVQELAADVYEKMGSLLQIAEGNPFEEAEPAPTPEP